MRIAVVVDTYDDTGQGTTVSARRFISELRKRGHHVIVLSYSNRSEPDKVIFDQYHLPIFQPLIDKNGINLAKPDVKKFKEAFKDVDLVHIYVPLPFGWTAAKVAHEMGVPVFTAFHMHPGNVLYNIKLEHVPFLEKFLFRFFHKKLYQYSTDIHCPTQFVYDTLRAHGYKQELHVISNGYDDKRFYPMEVERPDSWKDKFVVMCVGRLSREKKQDVVIKAIAHSKYKDNILLVLAGNGPKRKKYEKLIKKYKINAEFKFFSQDELPKALNAADLYVHCAQIEIESISCMEAFATGLVPVIGDSKKSATHYFALDERSKFKDGDYMDLCRKIEYWIEHPDELNTMSTEYAEHAKNYALEKSVDKIEEVYEKFLSKHRHHKPLHIPQQESIELEESLVQPIEADGMTEEKVVF
ncbi:MAG TPA: glycosyltransferase [Clostridia bacterium]|jgi:1,2-diacylglycerol 3-alpha-glucosyltransferase